MSAPVPAGRRWFPPWTSTGSWTMWACSPWREWRAWSCWSPTARATQSRCSPCLVCLVSAVNEVGGGRHLKLKLTASGRSFDAIFFSATAEEAGVGPGDRVDVAFTPQINEYRGWRSVQLQLCDLRPALTRAQAERALYEKFRRGSPSPGRRRRPCCPAGRSSSPCGAT
ncbi:MAG: hypothetical protein ACLRNQ_18980 [Flavonifractor plautii]